MTGKAAAAGTGPVQAPPAADRGGKYLTFFLGAEEYGFEILKVREILGRVDVTAVPQGPADLAGVVDLRGSVIPIVNLRRRFGMPAVESTGESCVVVVESAGRALGLAIDRVSEVVDIPGVEIEKAPEFGGNLATGCLLGIGRSGGRVRILLDTDRVVAGPAGRAA